MIHDIIIRDLRAAAHAGNEQVLAVELLLMGLDELSKVDGLPAGIVDICRRLIARFAATCGEHVVVVLGVQLPANSGIHTAVQFVFGLQKWFVINPSGD